MKKEIKGFVVGILVAFLLINTINGATSQLIDVVMNQVNFAIDGSTVAVKGQSYQLSNGDSVPFTILYKGTTYLPIRKISEIIGKDIGWDGTTSTVYLGQQPTPVASGWNLVDSKWVVQLPEDGFYFNEGGAIADGSMYGNSGTVSASKALSFGFTMTWSPMPAVLNSGSSYSMDLEAFVNNYSDPHDEYAYPNAMMSVYYGFETQDGKPLRTNYITSDSTDLTYSESYIAANTDPSPYYPISKRTISFVAPDKGTSDYFYVVVEVQNYGYWVYQYMWK